MWELDPAPAVPAVALSGFALSEAMSSGKVLAGRELRRNNHRIAWQQDHGFEAGEHVVWERIDRRIGHVSAEMAEADCVAVGCGTNRAPDADRAARPRHVFNENGLAERRLHALAMVWRDTPITCGKPLEPALGGVYDVPPNGGMPWTSTAASRSSGGLLSSPWAA